MLRINHRLLNMASVREQVTRAASSFFEKPLNFVDGVRVDASQPTHSFVVEEPATGKQLCKCPSSGQEDVNKAVQSAREAFKSWSQLSGLDRGRLLQKAALKLRERQEEFARMESVDQGKPLWESRFDIETVIDGLEYFAGLAPSITGDHLPLQGGSFGIVKREPLGVCVGIGPWNYPVQMAGWKSAPALACGNTMVYKPSQFTPITTVMLAELYIEVGIPKGVFNVVQGEGETGRFLTCHPGVDKVSFTGSVPTGKKVMADCALGIKHVTLELGGKSPLLIFADADMENAVKGAMMANFLTQGEVCCNGTRVFVERSIKDEFVEKLVSKTKGMKIGDPTKDGTMMGAVISKEHKEKVLNYVQGAKKQGAKVLCGGESFKPDDPALSGGYYMTPCILDQVEDHMTVAKEEIFGPVLSLFTFDTEEEAVRRANDSEFGLAAGVFTNDLKRAHRLSAQLEAGYVWVNNFNLNPVGLPFGGFKQSGIGRENAAATINQFTQQKSVYFEMGDVDCPY
ncbi:4-trimethylaminobutyraldehyde dehydrogenase-like [Apostichopus japonicus]|uniref:4-trimethylaminobutyraldehyde dehydrogenase-like n=1 Tax=Stichopus japonicus TaxID=307972 RepID=UPI003AB21ADE